jgi:hypothetical protein
MAMPAWCVPIHASVHLLARVCLSTLFCNCRALVALPAQLGQLSALRDLDLSVTDGIQEGLGAIGRLAALRTLQMR